VLEKVELLMNFPKTKIKYHGIIFLKNLDIHFFKFVNTKITKINITNKKIIC